MKKKAEAKLGLYLVTPERKLGIVWPSIPKDARPGESQYCYFARKYIEAQAAHTNARVQSEIDAITGQMINVEQKLLAAQNANVDVELLKEELATLQSERKVKRKSLVFQPIKKGDPKVTYPLISRPLLFETFR